MVGAILASHTLQCRLDTHLPIATHVVIFCVSVCISDGRGPQKGRMNLVMEISYAPFVSATPLDR